jgi:ribonuclease HIII
MNNVIDKKIFFLKRKKYNRLVRASTTNATKVIKNSHNTVSYGLLHRRLKRRIRSKAILNLNFNKDANHVDFNKKDR